MKILSCQIFITYFLLLNMGEILKNIHTTMKANSWLVNQVTTPIQLLRCDSQAPKSIKGVIKVA